MDDVFTRVWQDFVARTTGPLWFRLIVQPLVAAVLGVRAGLANARPGPSGSKFRQGMQDVGKVFGVGVLLDVVFQLIALRNLYPIEALVVAFLLVAVPYQIIRTITGGLASKR